MEQERELHAANAKSPAGNDKADVNPLPSAYVSQNPKVQALMHDAEIAFAKNDAATAFQNYKAAAELEPTFYLATLYTGDACFRANDYVCAREWFEKAIVVNPNVTRQADVSF